jgi:heat shock 70kDa protein 1/2/6/8
LIGDAAKDQAAMNPINTIFDAKRLIGRKMDDPAIISDLKHWPFKVIGKDDNKPHIQGMGIVISIQILDKSLTL